MLVLGNVVSGSSAKNLAANTAATASQNGLAVRAGKHGVKADSCQHLTKRDLSYFSSERFAKTLKVMEDRELASKYGELIAKRKRASQRDRLVIAVESVIYVDIFDAHNDGFRWSFNEVKDLFKGYRSQALREAEKAKGLNKSFYFQLAKALQDKEYIRDFVKSINAPVVREHIVL